MADALNAEGYRTTGNRGRNPFTKDTVRRLLTNRFYLGELPAGDSGWVPGKHVALVDADLFVAAQRAREANHRATAGRVNWRHRRHSLSGIGLCGTCGGRPLDESSGRPGIGLAGECYRRRRPPGGTDGGARGGR